jgi:predicted RNA-binding Zn-ribbon protein involved in translation (DUF1610 family)
MTETSIALPKHRLWDREASILIPCVDHRCRVMDDGVSDCGEYACPNCGVSRVVRVEDGLEPIFFCEECGGSWAG